MSKSFRHLAVNSSNRQRRTNHNKQPRCSQISRQCLDEESPSGRGRKQKNIFFSKHASRCIGTRRSRQKHRKMSVWCFFLFVLLQGMAKRSQSHTGLIPLWNAAECSQSVEFWGFYLEGRGRFVHFLCLKFLRNASGDKITSKKGELCPRSILYSLHKALHGGYTSCTTDDHVPGNISHHASCSHSHKYFWFHIWEVGNKRETLETRPRWDSLVQVKRGNNCFNRQNQQKHSRWCSG